MKGLPALSRNHATRRRCVDVETLEGALRVERGADFPSYGAEYLT